LLALTTCGSYSDSAEWGHNEWPAGLLPKLVLLLAKVRNGPREYFKFDVQAGLPIA